MKNRQLVILQEKQENVLFFFIVFLHTFATQKKKTEQQP